MDKITENCTGCRTCELLCPKGAIGFVADKEGFSVPSINQLLCVNCGLCQSRCPQNLSMGRSIPQRTIAVRYKNDEVLYKSASGGAFAAMALSVIRNGGSVFGVEYDKEWNAVFASAESEEQLMPILSSKYVQADTLQSYREVEKLLKKGRQVLYCGTGCQIGGLKSFLHKEYDNLIIIDLICHGVSSPLLFRKYVAWLSEKHTSPILEYDFRDKRGGWGLGYKYKYKYKYKYVYHSCNLDPYYYHFLKGDAYRECCYLCKYCTKERVGDITIGDYWGIEKEHPQFFSTKGVSVVLLNSKKGVDFFGSIDNLFHICESSFEQAAKHNQNLLRPTHRLAERNTIYEDIADRDFADLSFVKAFRPSWKSRLKELIPPSVKLLIKKSQK